MQIVPRKNLFRLINGEQYIYSSQLKDSFLKLNFSNAIFYMKLYFIVNMQCTRTKSRYHFKMINQQSQQFLHFYIFKKTRTLSSNCSENSDVNLKFKIRMYKEYFKTEVTSVEKRKSRLYVLGVGTQSLQIHTLLLYF